MFYLTFDLCYVLCIQPTVVTVVLLINTYIMVLLVCICDQQHFPVWTRSSKSKKFTSFWMSFHHLWPKFDLCDTEFGSNNIYFHSDLLTSMITWNIEEEVKELWRSLALFVVQRDKMLIFSTKKTVYLAGDLLTFDPYERSKYTQHRILQSM